MRGPVRKRSLIEQHDDVATETWVATLVQRQILPAIAIEIGTHEGPGSTASLEAQLGLEGPIPLSEQHRDVVIEHGDIHPPIGVQVRDDERMRSVSGARPRLGCERPIAIAE